MRVWKQLPARDARWTVRHDVDAFVNAAHEQPSVAIAMLAADRGLATAVSSWGETALNAASHLGHKGLIHSILELGGQIDIFAACATGALDAVQAMLPDTPLDACGVHDLPLLHFAVMSRGLEVLQLLLNAGVTLNPIQASLSPLHSAVAIGSVPMIRALVTAGVDCEVTDAYGATALDWAYDIEDRGSVIAVVLSGYLRRAAADLPTAG
ncbi:MAG TPA: ankyrin repeat domain-containing protein [Candidatus Dormibacteraeota bacterium]|nr:ankyrin repeat domain-containing protein [Candidatus Dormibacteraeota bacterium]